MAYREFYKPIQHEVADSGYIAQGVSNLFRGIQQKQEQRRKAADQFKYDLDKGQYETDTKVLTELANSVTSRAKQEIRDANKLSLDTERLMKDGLGWQQMSRNQMDREKLLRQNINDRGVRDKFYNAQADLDKLHTLHDQNVDFRTRGQVLDQIESSVGDIGTFKFDDYRADYVKNKIGAQYKDIETPLKSGGTVSKYNQAAFWDEDRGVPGVTDKHAIRFIESDPRVAEYYDNMVSSQLDQEIKAMKATGDERMAWMKGLSDAEIKNEIINDPKKNLVNSEEYGSRVRAQAKADLKEADRVNSKVSYTSLNEDKNGSGGLWKNQNILHDNTINTLSVESKKLGDDQSAAFTTYGPGGRFTQKSGKPIQIDTTNPIRTDVNRGITTKNNKGNLKLNMTGYQLMPAKKGQAPFLLKSSTPDKMIDEINNLPLEYFDPNGSIGLQPEMKIGLNGYTINEAGVLNDIQDQMFNIASQINEAKQKNDKEKLASLENMEYSLNELKDMIGQGDYDQQDLILAGNKAGIRKIQQNLIIPADQSDLSTIKNVTGGFDLRDRQYWSPEMIAVSEAYKKRYGEAKANGFGKKDGEKMYNIKNKQYSQAAVEKAAKLSGMTVDEYLSEVNK